MSPTALAAALLASLPAAPGPRVPSERPAAAPVQDAAEDGEPAPHLAVVPLESPAPVPSHLGNLAAGADGRAYLTWVEPTETGSRLRLAASAEPPADASGGASAGAGPTGAWSEPRTVAEGERWFENWADFPGVAALRDGTLLAYWLERFPNPEYPAGYYAWLRLSEDGGETWSPRLRLHDDRSPVEHGFVTAVPLDHARFGVAWLDGRAGAEAALAQESPDHGHAETALYFRTVDRAGELGQEVVLDPRVCDCCQTDGLVLAGAGPFFVYRDRDEREVRDVSGVGRARSGWAEPRSLARDAWTITGCPVNGPSLAARGRRVGLVRFTEGRATLRPERPVVLASLSRTGGETFEPLGVVDDGDPLGRVDSALLPDGTLVVSWLERVADGAEWRARAYSPDGVRGPSCTIAATTPMRAAGFARLAADGDGVRVVWTDVEAQRVRTARLRLR